MKSDQAYLRESTLMSSEVELAGEFIYTAINKINAMISMDEPTDSFFVMYHLSVGIERLQKVLLVIIEDVTFEDMGKFLEGIKVHDLLKLDSKIQSHVKIGFSPEQKALLKSLSEFYKEHRYSNYDFYSYNMQALNSLSSFLKQNYDKYNDSYSYLSEHYLNTDDIKSFLGRCIGKICQKYYQKIYEESNARNIYCYELRYGSSADKIFRCGDLKKSYQKDIEEEENAIKELLIYLMNTKKKNAFLNFVRSIKPLDIDPALVEDYIEALCKKQVSTELIDEVHFLLHESEELTDKELAERKVMLSLIGKTPSGFDIIDDMNVFQKIRWKFNSVMYRFFKYK